jgi:hypothetical protein
MSPAVRISTGGIAGVRESFAACSDSYPCPDRQDIS